MVDHAWVAGSIESMSSTLPSAKRDRLVLSSLLGLKLFTAIVACFVPFTLPHVIRQLDTMGVSLRYWLRWTVEPSAPWPLLPAVLTAGETSGITPMEFPLMNLLYAPAFALPIEGARVVAMLAHVAACTALTVWHAWLWRGKKIAGAPADLAAMLLPIVGVSTMFIFRFMPDYLAFILISSAIALSWEKPRPIPSTLLAGLALLIKPPVIVAAALLLALPRERRSIRALAGHALWLAPAVIAALLYFKPGLAFIKSVSDYPPYFYTDLRNPLFSLATALARPDMMLALLNKDIFAPPFALVAVAHFAFWESFRVKANWQGSILWLVLALQILGVAALDGTHGFIHAYYYVGTSMTAALIFADLIARSGPRSWFPVLVYLPLVAFHVERALYETRPITGWIDGNGWYRQCQELKARNAEFPWDRGYRFRSEVTQYPELGICFGEIQNATRGDYGFFRIHEPLQEGCRVEDQTRDLKLVICNR